MSEAAVLGLGRSGLLLDALRAVADDGRHRVAAIITDEGSPEYDVDVDDFRRLAADVGAELVVTRAVTEELVAGLVERHGLQVGISANWRFLVPGAALAMLPHGFLNLHVGRLPDLKGNATANWAILTGEPEVCADVHRMDVELDAGDVLARATMPLTGSTYVADVLDFARAHSPRLFLDALERVETGGAPLVQGSVSGSRCYPRSPEDGLVDWADDACDIGRLVRATSRPYPGAFTTYGDQEVVVWRASVIQPGARLLAVPGQVLAVDRARGTVDVACGRGALRLEELGVGGETVPPTTLIRGIRLRLGQARRRTMEVRPA